MGIIKKFIGPSSKYDDSIPYTYIAKVRIIERDDNLVNHYFSDTICGLIECLSSNNILPEDAELFACYQKKKSRLIRNIVFLKTENGWRDLKSVIRLRNITNRQLKNNIKDMLNLVNVLSRIGIVKEVGLISYGYNLIILLIQ